MSVTVVVFTELLPVVEVVEGPGAEDGVCNLGVGVEKPLEGFEPGACWISFPCSAIRAGPNLMNCFRNCGTSFARTRSLTGALEFASE